ncbi:uncharacterized protein LOC121383175 [Gigantopelta aegis]|uniref:uncharacterized protein LOC121383175 n=1 Tax=Gigantopelta aegis TaxID=1735272 RepID=UPI001B887FC1|nr:uncharacterized protein LOC121383175 [Gigantopelta aegis]XP_041368952.1 uncharacterized protein LOC121383175 [Gigantopelta aegis]
MEEQVDDDDSGYTELFCGRVMHVLDPQNFWVQIGTQNCFDEFSSLEDSFQEFCEEVGTFPSIPAQSIEEGSYVLVTSPDEAGKCKRAQVARTNKEKGMVDVFYMDYGNTELVTTNRLCQAVPAYFFAVNLELMKCGLAGIRPIAKTWTGRGIKYFEKLTKEHILQAAIVSFKPLEMLNEISLYQQDGDQKSITHLLLEEEIGVPTDVLDSVLEFAKDVTRVLPDSYYEWYNSVEEQDDGNETQERNEVETDYQEETKESEETTKVAEISPQESACYSEDHSPGKSVYSDNNDFETDSCSLSPETPSPAIPSFDLSEILKTTMACPDTLEKKKDDERKKEAKLELQRDIQTICEDVPQPSTSATWEMTDLIIGKNNAHTNDGAISDKIAQIEKVTGSLTEMTKTSPIIPAKKLDGKLPDVSSIVKNGFLLLPTWTTSSAEDSPTECLEKDHSDDDSDDSEDRLVKQMTEIEFFEFSKQLEQILLHSECSDARVVSEEFYRIVPIDGARQPVGLLAALDVLVEHAVKNPDWQGLTLTILDSYCECANFANCLEKILKDSHTRFIRISPGKTLGYHSDFAQVLGQIFLYSRLWATSVSDIIQEYILSACERWVLFNKNNDQIGPRTKRLVEIYNECLVAFWNIAGDLVHDISPTNHRSLQAEVRDRILSDNIDRTLRQRYLLLLLSMLQPGLSLDMSKPVTHDTQCQTTHRAVAVFKFRRTKNSLHVSFHTSFQTLKPAEYPISGKVVVLLPRAS